MGNGNGVLSIQSGANLLFSYQLPSTPNISATFAPLTSTSIIQNPGLLGTTGGFITFNSSSAIQFAGTVGPVAAVPEPATWAMMIAGFGLAGAAMRRRAPRVTYQTA